MIAKELLVLAADDIEAHGLAIGQFYQPRGECVGTLFAPRHL